MIRPTTAGALLALASLFAAPAGACDELETATAARVQKHYRAGLTAQRAGDATGAEKAFRAAVALDPDHAPSRRALGDVQTPEGWIGRGAAMKAKGLVLRDGRWILREEAAILELPAQEKAHRTAARKKARDLLAAYGAAAGDRSRRLARAALDTVDDAAKLEPFAYALRSGSKAVRLLAAEELGRLANRRGLRPLLHRVIHDPAEEVRHAALAAAQKIGVDNLIAPLVRALGSENAQVRSNAADAIGRAGDVRGVEYLVYRFEAHGGGAPRTYSMTAAQLSFIQDFDVEVASTAFIADPIVNTVQEGTVLDVQVVATSQEFLFAERHVIHGALRRLTGADDVPEKTGAWAAWLRERNEAAAQRRETETADGG